MPRKRGRARKTTRRPRTDPAPRERALDALNRMRSEGLSLKQAARHAHTTPGTVRKYIGGVISKRPSGRYAAAPSDRLTRYVWFLTKDGKVERAVRGSRQAERLARHMAAVDRYLKTGDTDPLGEFESQGIRSRNQFHPFLTDTDALDRLANAGEVSFERLYTRRA
jgi:hypothetical protein